MFSVLSVVYNVFIFQLILCSTCLDYFGLRDRVEVGIVGGMPDIIEALSAAGKVISL